MKGYENEGKTQSANFFLSGIRKTRIQDNDSTLKPKDFELAAISTPNTLVGIAA